MRSTIVRAWSRRSRASSQRGDSGIRQNSASATTMFSPASSHR